MSDINIVLSEETFQIQTNFGKNGKGVIEGGTTGQILAKKTNQDFDTEWTDTVSTADDVTVDTTNFNNNFDSNDNTSQKIFDKIDDFNMFGALSYQQIWNADTNTPSLVSGTGTKGYYYVVSVKGTTNLDGVTDWQVGDWAIFNGTTWQKADHTDQVSSVFGRQGAVIAEDDDYNAGQITNTPTGNIAATDVQAAINELDGDNNTQDIAIGLNTMHRGLTNNPHSVTKAQVGLGNADNTSDVNKPVSIAQQNKIDTKVQKVASTDNAIAKFNGTGGEVQNSGVTISDNNDIIASGKGSFGNKVVSAGSARRNRAINLIDTSAMIKVHRIHTRYGTGIEMITSGTATSGYLSYWDMFCQNGGDKSFFIRERLSGGAGISMKLTSQSGNAWFKANVSAASFTDRTPYPKTLQLSYDAVNSMQRLPDGEYKEDDKDHQLDHNKLHDYLKSSSDENARDMSATISVQNEVIKDLIKRIEALESK